MDEELDDYLDHNQSDKPIVVLCGEDGNAFAIIGKCRRAAKDAGWVTELWKEVMNEMTSGDYDHLLQTAMKYFDVR